MLITRTTRAAGWLVAVASCSLALAACGGDEGGGDAAAAGNAGTSNEQDAARVRLQDCLRENGVDVPDGPPGGDGDGGGGQPDIDRDELEQAMEACAEFRDEAFGDVDVDDQEFQDAFAKFSQCMRDEGIDLPEMTPGEGPPQGGGQLDQDDPETQAALEKCQDELPQGGFGPGGGGAP